MSSFDPYPTGPPPPRPPGEPGDPEPVVVQSLGVLAPAPRRTGRIVVAALVAAVLVGAAVALPVALREDPATLDAVQRYDDLRTDHVSGAQDYPTTPPVGGPHDPAWLDCGAYDEPVRDENAVHDLEHGTVWIAYRPDLSDDDLALLTDTLPQNGILAPYPDLPAPVVVTVWGRQLRLDGADDERLALFVDEYAGGVTAPEPLASCAGGLSESPAGPGTAV